HRYPTPCPTRRSSDLVSEVYNGDNRAHGRDIALIIQNELAPLLIGEDARHIERLWARMFQLSIPNRDRKQVMEAIACVDTALWEDRKSTRLNSSHQII